MAHSRLAWWREECERCAQGTAAHPVTREIARRCSQASLLQGLSGLIDTATWDLASATFATRRELQAYCARWSAAVIEPWALTASPATDAAALRELGAQLRESELLLALPAQARAGRLRLPLDELAAAAAEPQALVSPPWSAPLSALIGARLGALRAGLARAPHIARGRERRALRGILVWTSLTAAQLARAAARLAAGSAARATRSLLDGWRAWRAAWSAR